MRVLFVARANGQNYISPIVQAQADSLIEEGIKLDIFKITGKGFLSYLKGAFRLRQFIRVNQSYDIIHAHYSLSGFTAALSGAKPLIVSLMGSEVSKGSLHRHLIKYFIKIYWDHCIIKSEWMKRDLFSEKISVIPNGVNLKLFKQEPIISAKEKLGWELGKTHILFASDPERKDKNFRLLEQAALLLDNDVIIKSLVNIQHSQIPDYLNASDVVTLPSLREGSPNVIKEAMACNRPIVATDVGDIKWLLSDIRGCFISTFLLEDYVDKLEQAIRFSREEHSTTGRSQIKNLGLQSCSIALKLKELYIKYES